MVLQRSRTNNGCTCVCVHVHVCIRNLLSGIGSRDYEGWEVHSWADAVTGPVRSQGWRRPVSPWRTLRQRENSPTHLAFHAGSGGTGQGPHPVGCICIRSPALQILTSPGNTRIKLDFSYLGTPRPVRLTHKLTITQITYFLGRIRKN